MLTVHRGQGWRALALLVFCLCAGIGHGQEVPTFSSRRSCPTINSPPDINKNQVNVYWPYPLATSSDGSPAAVTCDQPSGSTFSPGSHTVRCTAVDTANSDMTASCDVLVNIFPSFQVGCPSDIVQESSTAIFMTPVANPDSANVVSTVQCSHQSGDTFNPGLTVVTCSATDSANPSLVARCNFKVTIGTFPAFDDLGSCDGAAVVNVSPDSDQKTKTGIAGLWTIPTKAGSGHATCDPDPDTYKFLGGATNVTCVIADDNIPTLINTCRFQVRVYPYIEDVCPNIIITDNSKTIITPPNAVGSDGSVITAECDKNTNDSFGFGQQDVHCVATDVVLVNQSASCSFIVAISYVPGFFVTCRDYKVWADSGMGSATGIKWDRPTGPRGPATCTPDPDTATFVGLSTEVVCTASAHNAVLSTSTCAFNVSVFPAFIEESLPHDTFRSPDPDANTATFAYVTPGAITKDGTGVPVTCTPPSGTTFHGGDNIIRCIATDPNSDHSSTYTFKLYVAPTFKTPCPENFMEATNPVNFVKPIGNLDTRESPFPVTCSKKVSDVFTPGQTPVTCTVTDPVSKLTATCSFKVTFLTAPTFDASCRDDFNVEPTPGSDTAMSVTWPRRTAQQSNNDPARVTCEPARGTNFKAGDTSVTCTAADTRLPTNTTAKAKCDFRVRVYPTFVSGCPDDIFMHPDTPGNTTVVNFVTPEGAIDSGGKLAARVTCNPASGTPLPNNDVTLVSCTALDSVTLDEATCSFNVSFKEGTSLSGSQLRNNTTPVCYMKKPGNHTKFILFDPSPPCDEDFNVQPSSGQNNALAVNWPERTATQADGTKAMVTCDPARGSDFDGGDTLVTCTAVHKDIPSLTASCDFNVRVYPTFVTGCSQNQVEQPSQENMTVVDFDIPAGALDSNGTAAAVSCEPNPGTAFPNNVPTDVTCTAVDSDIVTFPKGTTCIFKVIVGEAPTFAQGCPSRIIVAPDKNGLAVVTWDEVTGNLDSTGQPAMVTCDYESGSTFNETETVVTCIATDAGTQLTANCTFVVILDSEPPSITCPPNIKKAADNGQNTAVVSWDDPTVSDRYTQASGIKVLCLPKSGSVFQYGETTVNCLAGDSYNNIGTCAFTVTVEGAVCSSQCPTHSTCMILKNGQSKCVCDKGYAGSDCTKENECAKSPCHANADCAELEPPELFSCTCKSGFYGDGVRKCERFVQPEYPHLPVADGSGDLKRRFLVTLAITTSSAGGCDPDIDKMSFECTALIKVFMKLVFPLYKKVSAESFLEVLLNQTDLRKGSVILPHVVHYDYSKVRKLHVDSFFTMSVQPSVKAGQLGIFQLGSCTDCGKPQDITNVCSEVDRSSIQCPRGLLLFEDKNETTGRCVFSCISQCQANTKYCNGGVCSQDEGNEPICSECPSETQIPRCAEGPKSWNDTPLVIGLSVGLGGGLLLVIVLNMIYIVCRRRDPRRFNFLRAGRPNSASFLLQDHSSMSDQDEFCSES